MVDTPGWVGIHTNILQGNGGSGLLLQSQVIHHARLQVQSNVVHGNRDGIVLHDASLVSLDDNWISSNRDAGLRLEPRGLYDFRLPADRNLYHGNGLLDALREKGAADLEAWRALPLPYTMEDYAPCRLVDAALLEELPEGAPLSR